MQVETQKGRSSLAEFDEFRASAVTACSQRSYSELLEGEKYNGCRISDIIPSEIVCLTNFSSRHLKHSLNCDSFVLFIISLNI